ncbi:putative protein phosphatase 2C 46 [Carex rostrata]
MDLYVSEGNQLFSTSDSHSSYLYRIQLVGHWTGLFCTIVVTRAIGDVYLNHNEFNKAPVPDKYRQSDLIIQPFLKAEPTIETYPLGPNDRFVIFASHGFWDQTNNEDAANIVKNLWGNRNSAAKRLLCRVLEHKLQTQYGETRHVELVQLYDTALYVDDTSVVILFLDKLQESRIIS